MFEQFGQVMEMVKQLQQQVNRIQDDLRNEKITLSSGDALTVTVNGQQEILSIEINPAYLAPEHVGILQDLLAATLNNAYTKSREMSQNAMNKLTADLNLPKIPGLF